MVAAIQVTSAGGRDVERKLARLAEAFDDLFPLLDGMGEYLEGTTVERFELERGPDGSAWTKSARAKRDGGKTLTDSTQLRSSVTHETGANFTRVGTNKVYAGAHQFGFDGNVTVKAHRRTATEIFGRRLREPVTFDVGAFERHMKLPARPFLGVSTEDESELLAQVADYTRAALGGRA